MNTFRVIELLDGGFWLRLTGQSEDLQIGEGKKFVAQNRETIAMVKELGYTPERVNDVQMMRRVRRNNGLPAEG